MRARVETQSSPPKYDSREGDGRGEVYCQLVVAGGNVAPVLDASEGAFDAISFPAGFGIVGNWFFAGSG